MRGLAEGGDSMLVTQLETVFPQTWYNVPKALNTH